MVLQSLKNGFGDRQNALPIFEKKRKKSPTIIQTVKN